MVHLQAGFGVSERRACRVVGQNRSTQRRPQVPRSDEDIRLRACLRAFSRRHPRWGWRRAAACARQGRLEGQLQTRPAAMAGRGPKSAVPAEETTVEMSSRIGPTAPRHPCRRGLRLPFRPNVVWVLDFQFDQTDDAKTLKLLNIVEEFTRECLAIVVERRIGADDVVACLDKMAGERGAPTYVRFDLGPEFIAYAVADWCRFNGAGTIFIGSHAAKMCGHLYT